MYVGAYDGGNKYWAEVSFQMPNLGVQANPFTAGTLTLTVNGSQTNNSYGDQVSDTIILTSGVSPLTRASGTVLGSDRGVSGE